MKQMCLLSSIVQPNFGAKGTTILLGFVRKFLAIGGHPRIVWEELSKEHNEIPALSMELNVKHRFIKTNGIRMHIAEQGSGPLVLLLHGFPETWYSWRHQIPELARAGYHVVVPDMRGYGETDAPEGIEQYTSFHIVGDIIGLLDFFKEAKAFVIGHDWGAQIGWRLCQFRPDRVHAFVSISVHFQPRKEGKPPVKRLHEILGEGYYYCRFQKPGRAEADFARFDTACVLKKFILTSKSGLLLASVDKEICDVLSPPNDLPSWITEEEIQCYARQFERTGFSGPLNYYRATDLTWEFMAPWTGQGVQVPVLHIVGDRDTVYHTPGAKRYIHDGGFSKDVPQLKGVIVLKGSHFIHEEQFKEVNTSILNFLKDFSNVRSKL